MNFFARNFKVHRIENIRMTMKGLTEDKITISRGKTIIKGVVCLLFKE
jgi:hypothetical protein